MSLLPDSESNLCMQISGRYLLMTDGCGAGNDRFSHIESERRDIKSESVCCLPSAKKLTMSRYRLVPKNRIYSRISDLVDRIIIYGDNALYDVGLMGDALESNYAFKLYTLKKETYKDADKNINHDHGSFRMYGDQDKVFFFPSTKMSLKCVDRYGDKTVIFTGTSDFEQYAAFQIVAPLLIQRGVVSADHDFSDGKTAAHVNLCTGKALFMLVMKDNIPHLVQKVVFVDIVTRERPENLIRTIYEAHFSSDGQGYLITRVCGTYSALLMTDKSEETIRPTKTVVIYYSFSKLSDKTEGAFNIHTLNGFLTIQSRSYIMEQYQSSNFLDCRKTGPVYGRCLCDAVQSAKVFYQETIYQVLYGLEKTHN